MTNLLLINVMPKHVTVSFMKQQNVIKKLHNTALINLFIKKALFNPIQDGGRSKKGPLTVFPL